MHFPYRLWLPVFNNHTFRVILDGRQIPSLEQLYHELAIRFQFPDYFQPNLDALYDCLTDLSQLPPNYLKAALIIHHSEAFLNSESDERRKALYQVFEEAQVTDNRYDSVQFEVYLLHD
jgi:RNAse (barnase) inhibitor barstar